MANVSLNIVLGAVNNLRPGLQVAENELRGLRAQAKAITDDMKTAWGEVSQLSRQAGAGLVAAGAGTVAGLLAAAKGAADYGSAIWDAHTRTGASVETLQQLQYAAQQTGADMGTVELGLKRLAVTARDAANGTGEAADIYKQLGISVTDSNGQIKPSAQLMMEVGEALRNVKSDSERAAIAVRLFGRSGTMLLPMFMDSQKSLKQFADEASRLGLVMDEQSIAAADDFGDALDRVGAQTKIAAMSFGFALIPTLQQAADWFSGALSRAREFVSEHQKLVVVASVAALALGLLAVPIGTLLILLPGAVQAWNLLTNAQLLAKGAALVTKAEMIGAGIAARISGMYATVASGGFKALAAGMLESLAAAAPLAIAIASVVAIILAAVGAATNMAKVFKALKEGRWQDALKLEANNISPAVAVKNGFAELKKWVGGAKDEFAGMFTPEGAKPGATSTDSAGALTPEKMAEQLRQLDAQAKDLQAESASATTDAAAELSAAAGNLSASAGKQPAMTKAVADAMQSAAGNLPTEAGAATAGAAFDVQELARTLADQTYSVRLVSGEVAATVAQTPTPQAQDTVNATAAQTMQAQTTLADAVQWQKRTDRQGNVEWTALREQNGLMQGQGSVTVSPQKVIVEHRLSSDGETARLLLGNPAAQDALARAVRDANYKAGSMTPAPSWG